MKKEKYIEYEKEWVKNKDEIRKYLKRKCEATADQIMEYLIANYRIEKLK